MYGILACRNWARIIFNAAQNETGIVEFRSSTRIPFSFNKTCMKYQHKMEQYHNLVELNLRIQCEKVEWNDNDNEDDEEKGATRGEAELLYLQYNSQSVYLCVCSFFGTLDIKTHYIYVWNTILWHAGCNVHLNLYVPNERRGSGWAKRQSRGFECLYAKLLND